MHKHHVIGLAAIALVIGVVVASPVDDILFAWFGVRFLKKK